MVLKHVSGKSEPKDIVGTIGDRRLMVNLVKRMADLESVQMPRITEETKEHPDDVSTVYAYLKVPERRPDGSVKKHDDFSCSQYQCGAERQFIEWLHSTFPGKYQDYHIGWDPSLI